MSPADPEPNLNSQRKIAYEPPEEDRPASAAPTENELEENVPTVAALDRSPRPAEHDPYAALRLPVYRLFMANYGLAVVGSGVMTVAIQWELAKATNSPMVMGLLGGLQALPVILLALVAGHVSDRFSRKRVLMVTQVALVMCPLLLAWLVHYEHGATHYLAWVFLIILINAVALTFARPARQSILPQIVPTEIFSNAVTWNASFFETASITGPAIDHRAVQRFWRAAFQRRLHVDLFFPDMAVAERSGGESRGDDERAEFDRGCEICIQQKAPHCGDDDGSVCGAAGRRGVSAAAVCDADFACGFVRIRIAAGGAVGGRGVDGVVFGASAADAARGEIAAAGGCGFWIGDDCFWVVALVLAEHGDVVSDWGVRQHQRGGAAHAGAVADAGSHAGAGLGGEHDLHRIEQ
jgi:nitrate/nitrite transporter NarK